MVVGGVEGEHAAVHVLREWEALVGVGPADLAHGDAQPADGLEPGAGFAGGELRVAAGRKVVEEVVEVGAVAQDEVAAARREFRGPGGVEPAAAAGGDP